MGLKVIPNSVPCGPAQRGGYELPFAGRLTDLSIDEFPTMRDRRGYTIPIWPRMWQARTKQAFM